MVCTNFPTIQLFLNDFCQLFAQLHTPLIEGIDLPDHALHKNLVFVQCDQHAQHKGRQPGYSNELVGLLPGNTLCAASAYNSSSGRPSASSSSLASFGLAPHQRLGLGNTIREQDMLLILERVVGLTAIRKSQGISAVPW